MSKRMHAKSNSGVEVEGASRHKRRREDRMSSDVDIMMSNPGESKGRAGGVLSKAEVKGMGTTLWQTVKDAVKDGRQLSVPFLIKPSKQDYPDYYFFIQNPIALDDIKKHLNKGKYSSLGAVKDDFELLFGNAKQYNRPDSIIYEDADYLLKLAHKTYNKLVPDQSDDDHPRSPDLYELLKERLDKLVSKSDSTDRLLSIEFMQLPSKKLWPFYYAEIKNPKCFDDVYDNLKQKVYDSSAEFAADVELIFSNALAFNQDGTQIFNDAATLRDYFRRLMSDLPSPYSLPEYTKPSNKIRIRPVHATQTATPRSVATKQESTPLTLKVPPVQPPPAQVAAPSQASTPALGVNTSTLPVAPATVPRPPPVRASAAKPSTSQAQPAKKSATPQPAATGLPSFISATPSHYPRTQTPQVAVAPVPTVVPTVAPTPVLRASSVLNTNQTRPQTPAPIVYPLSRQLKWVNVQIQPNHRRLRLDHRDGVKTWFVRLVPGESSLLVNDVTYMEEEVEESSDDEEKEEDDDSMDVDHEVSPSKETRKKGKGRGRGRPPKAILAAKAQAAAAKAAKTAKKKVSRKPEDIQLKLNNLIVSEQPEKPGEWNVGLVTGSNVIEIGEAGGMIWKLHAERIPDA